MRMLARRRIGELDLKYMIRYCSVGLICCVFCFRWLWNCKYKMFSRHGTYNEQISYEIETCQSRMRFCKVLWCDVNKRTEGYSSAYLNDIVDFVSETYEDRWLVNMGILALVTENVTAVLWLYMCNYASERFNFTSRILYV